ncbi:MAG: hypothetical protein LBP20_04155 [Treponema sp.]|jgi:hypothetical protein|nr:hypothetical protein [Treponema sp.]
MARGIFYIEIDGARRLGFDTGLNAQAFAQAKLTQFITQEGHIVLPDAAVSPWQPGGVIESEGTMVVWGPDFEGERLDLLLAPGREDLALDALRYWLAAWPLVPQTGSWPAGVFVVIRAGGPYPAGTILFPPERLRCRCIQAEAGDRWLDGGESLVFPDFTGKAAASFTAGAMLYRIFANAAGSAGAIPAGDAVRSGVLPFSSRDPERLHQDMREGVFLPLNLAAPGLDPQAAELVDRAIAGLKGQAAPRPSLEEVAELLGPPAGAGPGGAESGGPGREAASFFRELDTREQDRLREERERCEKKRNLTVGTRRFLVRNTAIITGIAAALAVVIMFVGSMISSRRGLPTTGGMNSLEVVETYYGAFATLDHTLMEACVIDKAGKGDIDMVTRFFVTSRVRQAYEFSSVTVSAEDWFAAGAPPTTAQILGVTNLNITRLAGDEDGDEARYRAEYIIWLPGANEDSEGIVAIPGPAPELPPDTGAPESFLSTEDFVPPRGYPLIDELTLIRHKGNWRISRIDRNASDPPDGPWR